MDAMSGAAASVRPSAAARRFHDRKFQVYLEMYRDQKKYEAIMTG